jgi:hypothetical protein
MRLKRQVKKIEGIRDPGIDPGRIKRASPSPHRDDLKYLQLSSGLLYQSQTSKRWRMIETSNALANAFEL